MALSKLKMIDADQTLIKGLTANFPAKATFQVANTTLTVPNLVKLLTARIAARTKTSAAKTAYAAAVAAEEEMEAELAPIRRGVQRTLQGRYGDNNTKLAEFGFTPSKRAKPTAEVTAAAVKQSKATRVARGTLSKKQKKTIKGVVSADGGVTAGGGGVSAAPVASKSTQAAGGAATTTTGGNASS